MRKFLSDGQEVEVQQELPNGGALVVNIMLEQDGEEFEDGEPYFVKRVFDTEPVLKFGPEIAGLQLAIKNMQEERNGLLGELRALRRDMAAAKERRSKTPGLEKLDALIEGRVTHLVELVAADAPWVKTLSKADGWKVDDFALTGGRRADHDTWWKWVFRDGNGYSTDTRVILCESQDEAIAICRSHCVEAFTRKEIPTHSKGLWIKAAQAVQIEPPPEWVAEVKAAKVAALKNSVAAAQKNLAEYEAALAALERES